MSEKTTDRILSEIVQYGCGYTSSKEVAEKFYCLGFNTRRMEPEWDVLPILWKITYPAISDLLRETKILKRLKKTDLGFLLTHPDKDVREFANKEN